MSFCGNRPVVIDVGSGFTKMGLAGNIEPQFVLPTCVASSTKTQQRAHGVSHSGISEYDFYIGDEAYQRKDSPNYLLSYPVAKGRVENWDDMERFLHQALFRNMRCVPEDHLFLLTEAAFATPQQREFTAEIMFETFNVKGLHIAIQALLALYARAVETRGDAANLDLTGVVCDSGDSLTHIIPVADGHVISSCIQEIPVGGKHVTDFVSDMLKDRGENVPPEQRYEAARHIKEKHSYLCQDVVAEYKKFDKDPKKFKKLEGKHFFTKEPWSIDIGYERFLAPEIFFHPEIFVESVSKPLPTIVNDCILNCPIDYRRRLYGNVVLAGGSTTFQHFKERLQRDLQQTVDNRLKEVTAQTGHAAQPIPVGVDGGKKKMTHFASWLGGSLFAGNDNFQSTCKMKAEYDEVGPACMRGHSVLG